MLSRSTNKRLRQRIMRNRTQAKISETFFKEQDTITSEQIFRELTMKMVKEMPFEELQKLITLKMIDPNSEESIKKIQDADTDDVERQFLRSLRHQQVILFEAEVNL